MGGLHLTFVSVQHSPLTRSSIHYESIIDGKLSAVMFKQNESISSEALKEKVDSFTLRSEQLVVKTGPRLLPLLGALVCVKGESYGGVAGKCK